MKRLSLLAAFCLIAACATSAPVARTAGEAAAEARTWVFVCADETSYVVRSTGSVAWVFRPGSGLRLEAVPGAVPPRYAQGEVSLAIDGDKGVLSEPGGQALTCINEPERAVWEHAKLDGVDFRGVGNEPPWVLEIREQSRIVLITNYGENRIERPLPQATGDPTRKTTRWDAGDLQIEITAVQCRDTMSGEAFGSRVVVHWQGEMLIGCGRPLH